jgi:hypothetical protein
MYFYLLQQLHEPQYAVGAEYADGADDLPSPFHERKIKINAVRREGVGRSTYGQVGVIREAICLLFFTFCRWLLSFQVSALGHMVV